MCERVPDISKDHLQDVRQRPSVTSLLKQNPTSLSPWLTSRETSSNDLAVTSGATICYPAGLELCINCSCCCCDGGKLHQATVDSSAVARQPFCGWEQSQRISILPSTGSAHVIFRQTSNQSIDSSRNSHGCKESSRSSVTGAFTKSKYSVYQHMSHKRTKFRCQVRSYIHGSDSRAILYQFEHHKADDISLYIDKYRKTITYPKMEQKSIALNQGGGPTLGDLSLWSGSRCVSSASVLKPKLFVLGDGSSASHNHHTRSFTCRKSYPHCTGFQHSMPEMNSKLPETKPKFRISNLNSAVQQHSSSAEERSRTEAKQYPIPTISGFSSLQSEPSENQSSEIKFVGAEEDSDAQLNMIWTSQSAPESYLASSVLYTAPSLTPPSIPRQRTVSTLSKYLSTSSVDFKGAMNINTFQSLNWKPSSGATLTTIPGKRIQSLSHNGSKNLTYGFQLSSHSMPLIKTAAQKTSGKTNRLGYLLKRKHRTDTNIRSTPSNDTGVVGVHGIY